VRISVIGTGGTIASTTSDDRDIALPELTPADLLKRLDLQDLEITPVDMFHEGSNTLTVTHVLRVTEEVRRQTAAGAEAVVIAQGTATLPETSYLYDLLLGDCPPVVCTGAMRPMSDLVPDGPANLRDSLLFAAASVGFRRGVYVVIDGAVHAPIDVLKLHAATSAGFVSPGVGPLGWIDASEVRVRRERKVRQRPFAGLEQGVELIYAAFDASPVLPNSVAASSEVKGLVIGGFPGRGAVCSSWMEPLTRFSASGRPMLFTATSLTGRAVAKHGAQATARHLRELGAVMCGDMAPHKVRCLLMATLSETSNRDEIEEIVQRELAWS
jgi:L-asparaginase